MNAAEVLTGKKRLLPRLPVRKRDSWFDQVLSMNEKLLADQPWGLGLIESLGLTELISKQSKFETKNRVALILIDSTFEIALKEFIVSRPDLFPPSKYNNTFIANLFSNRTNVISEVVAKAPIPQNLLNKVRYYYNARNALIHQRATVHITDRDVEEFEGSVEKILKILFKLRFPKRYD
jgi:hypothetical protein